MNWFDSLLWPIMVAVAWIMTTFHKLFEVVGLDPAGGTAWVLSIVGLVIVIRILLIPLFVRQIRASRGMQLIQPELQAIQKKYKGKTDPASREAMSRETMELYRRHNTNPFASCLPILLQSPIFFALFRVLNSLRALSEGTYPNADNPRPVQAIGPLTQELAKQAESATVFGAPLSGWFLQDGATTATRIVTVILIIAMSVTTFTTQRQLTMKNMPKSALVGPMAQQQKVLLYVMPLIFAFSGVNFPIGVLVYWTVTNLWSMGQQFYTIRRMPAPGSAAEAAYKERQARKAAHRGVAPAEDKPVIEERPKGGQRQQPVRKDRQRPRPTGASQGGAKRSGAASPDGGKDEGGPETDAAPRRSEPSGAADGSGGEDKPRGANGPSGAGESRGANGSGGSRSAAGKQPARKKRQGPGSGPAGSGKSA